MNIAGFRVVDTELTYDKKDGYKFDRSIWSRNILNKLPVSASNLYAKNLFHFVSHLYDKKNDKININLEDEIIKKTLIK